VTSDAVRPAAPRGLPSRGPAPLRPRRNLAEDVADHIRDAILTGRLRPGERIDQDALAGELGVSRLPVREALIALDQEGLIHTLPRRGSYVQRLQPDDITDHYEIFGHVSGLAAARAATRLDEQGLAAVRAVHDAMAAATDPQEQERLNFEFHRLVNAAGASRRLTSVLRLLSRSLPMHYYEFVPGWSAAAQEQHGQILAALERGDPQAAQQAMQRHLADSAQHAVEVLRRLDFFDDDPGDGAR
jgi:DNA-binding GntR family transcriptional regulator